MSYKDRPHVKMFQSGTLTCLPMTAYEPLTHALTSGAVWWEGEDLWGSPLLVRLSSVTDVLLCTAESIAKAKAEEDAEGWQETT